MTEPDQPWTAPRILTELCDDALRLEILETFLRHAQPPVRAAASQRLAQVMKFRPQSMRKAKPAQKAKWMAARLRHPDLQEVFPEALLAFHSNQRRDLMAACLDRWGIPHEGGAIEADDFEPPSREAMDETLTALEGDHGREALLIYYASLGLLMGDDQPEWHEHGWAIVGAAVSSPAAE